jgi:hypothetical protein
LEGEKLSFEPEPTFSGRYKSLSARYQLSAQRYLLLPGAYRPGSRPYGLQRRAKKGRHEPYPRRGFL